MASKVWRDLSDPRLAVGRVDLESHLKEPIFENLEIPENLGPVQIVVDDHKIKRFAFTQNDYNSWYMTAGPDGGPRWGHPCLLGNDLLQLFTTRYKASATVGFHTEEQIWFDNPVRLGERVTLSGRYVEAYERRGQGYVVMEAQAIAEDGRSIIRHRGVEILRTVPGLIAGRGASESTERKITGDTPPDARTIEGISEDTRIGDVLKPLEKIFTAEQTAVFSRIGEFIRNTHNDFATARAAQLPTVIVQGQQQYGAMAELMAQAFGVSWFTGGWLRMKFVNPLDVFVPVTFSGVVTAIHRDEKGDKRYELECWARRISDNRLTAVGWASSSRP